MRTKITVDDYGDVSVLRDDPISGEITRVTYTVAPNTSPGRPSHVRIRDRAGQFPQVCERLSSTGRTLLATPESLPAVIRRELRRRVALERRELRGGHAGYRQHGGSR